MRPDGRELAWFELGMAAMAYQLQAVEESLYVHPIVGFNAPAAKEIIGIPGNVTLQILIVLGYPGDRSILNEKHLAAELSPRIRKPLGQIAAFETWNEALMPQPKA